MWEGGESVRGLNPSGEKGKKGGEQKNKSSRGHQHRGRGDIGQGQWEPKDAFIELGQETGKSGGREKGKGNEWGGRC